MIKMNSTAVVVTIAVVLGALLLSRELFWRFDENLDLRRVATITDSHGTPHQLHIHQVSDSPVDTVRRTFKDVRKGHTYVKLWIEGSADTLHTSIVGRYYSEIRGFRIATDSSTQIFLVPNTEHGLPTGWGQVVYFKPDGRLAHIQLMAMNVGDVDEDRILEVFDPNRNTFTRLDPATGTWVPVTINAVFPQKKN